MEKDIFLKELMKILFQSSVYLERVSFAPYSNDAVRQCIVHCLQTVVSSLLSSYPSVLQQEYNL
jgi:hypothetical protein